MREKDFDWRMSLSADYGGASTTMLVDLMDSLELEARLKSDESVNLCFFVR